MNGRGGEKPRPQMKEKKPPSSEELAALRERYEYTAKTFPDSDSLLLLAEVLLALGEVRSARRAVCDFTAKNGDCAGARLVLAKAHLMCWKAVSAEEELEKALDLEPGHEEASLLIIKIYRSAGKFARAHEIASSLHSASGENAIPAAEVSELERLRAAAEEEKKPKGGLFETDAMLNLYVSQGLYKDALEMLETLFARRPENDSYRRRREEIEALMSARRGA